MTKIKCDSLFCSNNENGVCKAEEIDLEYVYAGEAPQCTKNDDYKRRSLCHK